MIRLILALLVFVPAAAAASAQSLADVARKEAERREKLDTTSKVLTNKDLGPSRGSITPPPPVEAAEPDAAPQPEGGPPVSEEAQRAEDEQAWRQKMAAARVALERSEMFLDALQSKINALWAEFTARDDPAQRARIELERQRALTEFERVKNEVEQHRTAIADLEEEARRAGVPPGWLRPD